MRSPLILTVFVIFTGFVLISCGGNNAPAGASGGAKELRASGASQRLVRSDLAPVFFLDQLGDVSHPTGNQPARVSNARDIVFSGWAVDDAAKRPAGGVDVVIDETPLAADYGKARPDVAQAYKNSEYSSSGFTLTVPGGQLSKGQHMASIRVISNDKKSYYQSPAVPFIVE